MACFAGTVAGTQWRCAVFANTCASQHFLRLSFPSQHTHRPASTRPDGGWGVGGVHLTTIQGDRGHDFGRQSTFAVWAVMTHRPALASVRERRAPSQARPPPLIRGGWRMVTSTPQVFLEWTSVSGLRVCKPSPTATSTHPSPTATSKTARKIDSRSDQTPSHLDGLAADAGPSEPWLAAGLLEHEVHKPERRALCLRRPADRQSAMVRPR